MSKPIKLFVVYDTDKGVVCQHEKSAFNIDNLFRYLDVRPSPAEQESVARCIEAIKASGSMFAFISDDVKKFHYSREDLMREVNQYRTLKNVISSI